ncbi:MAG: dynamin family protein [Myxococcales bacterium]|nr:dynamin family protein [Myxococcales bacterium]MCB9626885.1 dynamin family protein [Sandaracinaceae bacterium]
MAADYTELRSEALTRLRNVARLAKSAGAATLAKTLEQDRIARLRDERFHLVVLGEFNHGKTTFVNALLGKAVLPSGVTPTTAVIHRIRHGEEQSATAVRTDGTEERLPFADIANYEVGGSAIADGVQHLDLEYPNTVLGEGVILVDTPGVNDLNDARAEITYEYIPKADAVIFLLDAGQILKESERQFIVGKLLSASRDKVVFVVNKMDLLDAEEQAEALAYARMNLAKLVPEPRVFGISAEQALEGAADSGLPELSEFLTRYLREERGRVLIDNGLEAGIRAAQTLVTGIEVQQRALQMEASDMERRLGALEADLDASEERIAARSARIRENIAAVKAVVRADVLSFGRSFAQSLPGEIDAAEAKDLQAHLAGFIEARFREFAEDQTEEIAKRLERVAEEAIAFVSEDAKTQAERLRKSLGEGGPALHLEVNTLAYDVSVFAVGAFGVTLMVLSNIVVGGAMALAAPVLAYVFRGRAEKQTKERAKAEAPKAVEDAAAKMADAFDERIDEFGQRLAAFVAQANAEVTRSVAELIRTAREARGRGESALAELSNGTGMTLVQLSDERAQMERLRASLWK